MTTTVTLEEILQLVQQLSPVDKVRLIEEITPQIKRELAKGEAKPWGASHFGFWILDWGIVCGSQFQKKHSPLSKAIGENGMLPNRVNLYEGCGGD